MSRYLRLPGSKSKYGSVTILRTAALLARDEGSGMRNHKSKFKTRKSRRVDDAAGEKAKAAGALDQAHGARIAQDESPRAFEPGGAGRKAFAGVLAADHFQAADETASGGDQQAPDT